MLSLVPPMEMAKEGIVGLNLPSVVPVGVGNTVRKARGTSCHQCKNTKSLNKLAYCANLFEKRTKPEKRRCRKKYCETCLLKFYNDSFEEIISKPWICASCRGLCCCAACERNKDKGKRYKRIHHDHSSNLYDASRMGAGFGLFGQSSVPDIQNLMANHYAPNHNPLYGFPSQFSSLANDSQDSLLRLQNQLALAQRLEASQQNGWQQQLGYPAYLGQESNNPLSLSIHQALAHQQQLQLRQLQSAQLQQLQSDQADSALQAAKQASSEATKKEKENKTGETDSESSGKSKKRSRDEEGSESESKRVETKESQSEKLQEPVNQYQQQLRLQQQLQSQLQLYLQQLSKGGSSSSQNAALSALGGLGGLSALGGLGGLGALSALGLGGIGGLSGLGNAAATASEGEGTESATDKKGSGTSSESDKSESGEGDEETPATSDLQARIAALAAQADLEGTNSTLGVNNPYSMMQQLQQYIQVHKDTQVADGDIISPEIVQLGMQQQLLEQFHKNVQSNEAAAAAVAQLTSGGNIPQHMLGANMMTMMGMGGGLGIMERMGWQGIDPSMMGWQQNPMLSAVTSASNPTLRPAPVKTDGFLAPTSPRRVS